MRPRQIAICVVSTAIILNSGNPASHGQSNVTSAHGPRADGRSAGPASVRCTKSKACSSFKELMDAGDQKIKLLVFGDPKNQTKHVAYVCPRPVDDAFSVVEFTLPPQSVYERPYNEQIAPFVDQSKQLNRDMLKSINSTQDMLSPFSPLATLGSPPIGDAVKREWLRAQASGFVYAYGYVSISLYQDGVPAGTLSDFGDWMEPAEAKRNTHSDPQWFTGGYSWLTSFNESHKNLYGAEDDPKHAHISLIPDTIDVSYSYNSTSGMLIHYNLQIQRVTGRFTESFKSSGQANQTAGSCMIFR